MQINVLLFAAAKEAAQRDSVSVDLDDQATAADLLAALAVQLPQVQPLLCSCRVAIDCTYVGSDAVITPDCEVALIPPVSGG